jgi:ParB family transcriptional regulator, chromosome partitioning protein
MEEKKVLQINLEDILPNRFQPRLRFHEVAINELAESIKKHGVIQPIVVRPIGDKFEIIAGERRFKASQIAGKNTIPAIVADLDDRNSAEVALIENVQREDLTPIEEAVSYKKILDMGYLTQTELANKLGKEQSTVANKLRLLNLHEDVQEALLDEEISERHARSLLKLNKEQQSDLLKTIVSKRLTVRKTDQAIEELLNKSEETAEVISFDFDTKEDEVNTMDGNKEINPGFIDIDRIEQEAQDIFVEKPEPKMEEFFNKVEEEKQPLEDLKTRKFFNFLPDENDEEQVEEKVDKIFDFSLKETPKIDVPVESIEEEKQFTNVFNDFEMKTEEKVEETVENIPSFTFGDLNEIDQKNENIDFNEFDFSKFENSEVKEESIPEVEEEIESIIPEIEEVVETNLPEIEQPEEMIPEIKFEDVKVPEYTPFYEEDDVIEEKVKEPIIFDSNKKDFMSVVNKLRTCANQIEADGFRVETDELDFEDTYQVIIKITKE